MKYAKQVLKHPEFVKLQKEISILEKERIYCRHELPHALDVCRIAWILFLEMCSGMNCSPTSDSRGDVASAGGTERNVSAERLSQQQFEDSFPFTAEPYGDRAIVLEEQEYIPYGCLPDQKMLSEIKDRIYVIGLLHDIGRVRQYETGERHASAGGTIADRILSDIGYPENLKAEALRIIAGHTGRSCRGGISKTGERSHSAQDSRLMGSYRKEISAAGEEFSIPGSVSGGQGSSQKEISAAGEEFSIHSPVSVGQRSSQKEIPTAGGGISVPGSVSEVQSFGQKEIPAAGEGYISEDRISRMIARCICRADHLSRNCFCCPAADTCCWSEEERNRTIFC